MNFSQADMKKPALLGFLGIREMLRTSIMRGREVRRIAEAEAAELELALHQSANLEDNQKTVSQITEI